MKAYGYPFGHLVHMTQDVWTPETVATWTYVRNYSYISYLPGIIVQKLAYPKGDRIALDQETEAEIGRLLRTEGTKDEIVPRHNLVFILVESLESWMLDENGLPEYTPNMKRYINDNRFAYCRNMAPQVRHGNSADGQMIALTGVLPVLNGAVVKSYRDNLFPNFGHFYPASAIVNPSPDCYNQDTMTVRYGFCQLFEPQQVTWNDKDVLREVKQFCDTATQPFCVVGITVSSHVPFVYGQQHPTFDVEGMPSTMSAYLSCLHYTDSCIGAVVESIRAGKLADNTVIVITGDHTIFRGRQTFSKLTEYAEEQGIDFRAGDTRSPLIVYSPDIQQNTQIYDECYQMDIFPTVLSLIGADGYVWKGFGVDLLDAEVRQERPISVTEAERLSDLMIRNDYFRTYNVLE